MGGEKSTGLRVSDVLEGSPPHGRGKVWLLPLVDFQSRITPAWAGKSFSITARGRVRRDHPRMGGEKQSKIQGKF